jgi:hypothetical protein
MATDEHNAFIAQAANKHIDLSTWHCRSNYEKESKAVLELIAEAAKSVETLVLPAWLRKIECWTFSKSKHLTSVHFPRSLKSIGKNTFAESSLEVNDLIIPMGLTALGMCAFGGCQNITGKLTTHITAEHAFGMCANITQLDLTSCEIIEERCFMGCGLLKLELPQSLRIIKRHAFKYCTQIEGDLIIPPFVSFIHPQAFERCDGMTRIEESIAEHFIAYYSWKVRGNVLMTLIRFDKEYRRAVEEKGESLGSDLSNIFLAGYSKEAQLIYKATAHVDGTDELANGICRLIISYLPKNERYYGTKCSNINIDLELEWLACAESEYFNSH